MINDINSYLTNMQKSISEKLFFIDKIDSNVFVDYGCADGTLLKQIKSLQPTAFCAGYDVSQEMIDMANLDNKDDIYFSTNWPSVLSTAYNRDGSTLILSSIIHEIYSYGSNKSIAEFWERVFYSRFDYIVIRDMMLSEDINKHSSIKDIFHVNFNSTWPKLSQFEAIWGSIIYKKNLIHYLLKYRFDANWDREVKENYLPITLENMHKIIPSNYSIVYEEHHLPFFVKEYVASTFDIDLQDNTHIKMILKRN